MVKKKPTNKQISAAVVLNSFKKELKKPVKKLNSVKRVTNNATNVIVMDNLKTLADIRKRVEEKHKSITGPIKQGLREVDALFQDTYETIDEWTEWGKDQTRKLIMAQDAKREKLEQKFAKGKVSGASLMRQQEALDTDMGAGVIRRVWTAIEVDATQTPREYMVPDERKIREALKAGKKVKGWKWEQVKQIAV